MSDAYSGYREWKRWGEFGSVSTAEARYFRRELRRLPPLTGQRVLEVGFGRGSFLRFARDQGAEVHGTERIPELLTEAREAGYAVCGTAELFANQQQQGRFDLVVAFDVIEHLDKPELQEFFASAHALLKPGGSFLARFPNGHSPFGRLYQHGDLTHKTLIGGRTIEHLAALTGFELVEVRNPRMQLVDNPLLQVVQLVQRGLRDLVEIAVGYTYFSRRLPLDPNLVAHLRRSSVAA